MAEPAAGRRKRQVRNSSCSGRLSPRVHAGCAMQQPFIYTRHATRVPSPARERLPRLFVLRVARRQRHAREGGAKWRVLLPCSCMAAIFCAPVLRL